VNLVGDSQRADVVANFVDQFLAHGVIAFLAGIEGHIGVDRLALDVVRIADDRGFGDLGMRDQ
jgi:hypothetical protein